MRKVSGWQQMVLITWITAIVAIYVIVEPGPVISRVAEYVPALRELKEWLMFLFTRDYIF